jgi:hypothetical protein
MTWREDPQQAHSEAQPVIISLTWSNGQIKNKKQKNLCKQRKKSQQNTGELCTSPDIIIWMLNDRFLV